MDEPHNQLQPVSGAGSNASREELLYLADQERHIRGMLHPDDHGELRASAVKEYALRSIAQCGVQTEGDARGNYEGRHPDDMVLHPLSEIREWDEALAVLGIQGSTQTPAEAISELNEEIERLRSSAEPVAWICELAHSIDNDRQYCDWRTHLSLVPPMVPEKSIRDLRPLYASPIEIALAKVEGEIDRRAALYCDRCKGRGYLVADAEWEPYAVQCDACKGRRPARSVTSRK